MLTNRSLILSTEHLRLQPMTDDHRDDFIDLFTNQEVAKTYMVPDFKTREEFVRLFENIKGMSSSSQRFVYGICLEDRLIGLLNDVGIADGVIELGYLIHPSQKGKGYATEALGAAIKELFRLGFPAVKTGAFAENNASMRVMEKCGMTRTGELEQIPYRGKEHTCIYYQIKNPSI